MLIAIIVSYTLCTNEKIYHIQHKCHLRFSPHTLALARVHWQMTIHLCISNEEAVTPPTHRGNLRIKSIIKENQQVFPKMPINAHRSIRAIPKMTSQSPKSNVTFLQYYNVKTKKLMNHLKKNEKTITQGY